MGIIFVHITGSPRKVAVSWSHISLRGKSFLFTYRRYANRRFGIIVSLARIVTLKLWGSCLEMSTCTGAIDML